MQGYKRYDFPAVLEETAKGISITFPDLPSCQTFSETIEFAKLMATDELERHLSHLSSGAFPIPDPSPVDTLHDTNVIMATVWV